jgi:predicted transglutaminase-like cysteine proteinase
MERLDELKEIHETMFKNFRYVTDKKKHGTVEHWEVIPEDFKLGDKWSSDCEDFAMAIRKICRDRNIDPTRLVVCFDETGEGHCVLEHEGYVFDNRYATLVTKKFLEQQGYKWIAVSGPEPGDPWFRLPQ